MQTQTTTGARPARVAKFEVLSPDGFLIDPENPTYRSKEKAREAFNQWKTRFSSQGYYSTVKDSQRVIIPLNELELHCKFNTI